MLCDGHGHPLHFHLTAGQSHESTALVPLLEGAEACATDGGGAPVAWPVALAGDKGYRADWIDEYLGEELGITPVIPSKENEDRSARPVAFDREAYRRNIIERLIGWLKECRRIFSRFEETAKNFGGMIKMAFIQRYLRLICKIGISDKT
jgi:transposase